MWSRAAALAALLLLSCRSEPQQPQFPSAHRDVAPIVGDTFSTEDARDRLGEAQQVMQLAGVRPGMWVADVGAGEGYYTVRLARVVGPKGRVLAEDIMPKVTDQLADRIQRQRLDNVAVRLGTPRTRSCRRTRSTASSWFTCTTRLRRPTPSCGTCAKG